MKIVPFHTSAEMYKGFADVREFESSQGRKAYVLMTNVKPEDEERIAEKLCMPVFDFVLTAGNLEVMIETCRVLKYANLTTPQYKLLMQRRNGSEFVCTTDLGAMPFEDVNLFVTGYK